MEYITTKGFGNRASLCLGTAGTVSGQSYALSLARILGLFMVYLRPIMNVVANATIARLRSKPPVQAELPHGAFHTPQDAFTASDDFRDTAGELLVTECAYIRRVRSGAHFAGAASVLAKMGVPPLRILHFMEELNHYISRDISSFSSKTAA